MQDQPLTSEYTIRPGAAETGRLGVQASVMADETEQFLVRTGVAAGWSCLDVGCGAGQVSLQLGRMVGPSGRVLGVDSAETTLAAARADAASATAENVRFQSGDVYQLPYLDEFDLGYARLLLSHLDEPVTALREMRNAVRPGGWVAVEDLYTDSLRSDPASSALEDLRTIYDATVRAFGGDPTIGPRLRALFARAGLANVRETTVVNEMTTADQKHFLVTLVDSMRVSMIECAAATAGEIDTVRAGVDAAAREPGWVFYQCRIHQVTGRVPGE